MIPDDLVQWLRAQLDEDERVARGAVGGWITKGPHPDDRTPVGSHIARHDPARVLREVEAKRHLLEQADLRGRAIRTATLDGGFFDHILRVLALPYAGHPDYRDEWRP